MIILKPETNLQKIGETDSKGVGYNQEKVSLNSFQSTLRILCCFLWVKPRNNELKKQKTNKKRAQKNNFQTSGKNRLF